MAIILPGIGKSVGNAALGIAGAGADIYERYKNPDKDRVAELQKAVDERRISAEELNDMTPEEIASKYNIRVESAKRFTTGKKSLKKQISDYTGAEIQRIMSDQSPEGIAARTEFLANNTGVRLPEQRTIGKANATLAANNAADSDNRTTIIQTALKSGDPAKVAAAQKALTGMATPDEEKLLGLQVKSAALNVAGTEATQPGMIAATNAQNAGAVDQAAITQRNRAAADNMLELYKGKNLFAEITKRGSRSEDLAVVYGDKQLTSIFESQQQQANLASEQALRREIASGRDVQQNIDLVNARKLSGLAASVGVFVSAGEIAKILDDPILYERWKDEKEPIEENKKSVWRAAQAMKAATGVDLDKRKAAATAKFIDDTKALRQRLNSPLALIQAGQNNDTEKAAIAKEYNDYAQMHFGDIYPPNEIPKIEIVPNEGAVTKLIKGLGSVYAPLINFGDRPGFRVIQGNGEGLVNVGKKSEPDSSSSDPDVDASVASINAKSVTLEDVMKSTKLTQAQKDAIKKRVSGGM